MHNKGLYYGFITWISVKGRYGFIKDETGCQLYFKMPTSWLIPRVLVNHFIFYDIYEGPDGKLSEAKNLSFY
jgi:hypothetical protein